LEYCNIVGASIATLEDKETRRKKIYNGMYKFRKRYHTSIHLSAEDNSVIDYWLIIDADCVLWLLFGVNVDHVVTLHTA
jgi:hypothetical protein